MYDLLIRGGLVVDGTGGTPFRGDVGIRDGRIVAVGELDEPAARVFDAAGKVIAPGFIDVHTHYDAQLLWDPLATPSPQHGVTTVIGGNCGFTLAPVRPDAHSYLGRLMARVEGIPLEAIEEAVAWDWTGFGDWLDRIDRPLGVNAAFLVGHSAVRRAVLGPAARPATPDEVQRMAAMVHEALEAGVLGFSSSLSPTHNDGDGQPVPSRFAEPEELIALAATLRDHPATALELIPGSFQRTDGFSDADVELMADMSVAAGVPLNWNLLKISARRPDRHEAQLAASDRARERGGRVVALTLPDVQRLRLTFATGFVLDAIPGWQSLFELPLGDRMAALRDPATRERLAADAASRKAGTMRAFTRWERVTVEETFSDANLGLVGRTVGDIAAERDQSPFDTLIDIVLADELRTGIVPQSEEEGDEAWRVRAETWLDERTVLGGSDAGAHLDMQCCANYTTNLLGESVRDRQLISLEEAVHQLTDVPARLYGLRDRGRLASGFHADIVVFDPGAVGSSATYTVADLPGGAERLISDARGIELVVVNGTPVIEHASATGELPGRLLRSTRDTDRVPLTGVDA